MKSGNPVGAVAVGAVLVLAGQWSSPASAGTFCNSTGADVIVGELHNLSNYDSESGIEALAVGTTSCNIGDVELNWVFNTNQHPVIGQNIFRLNNGRFEHLGQSWLKHGFTALQLDACACGCIDSGTGSRLGVGCSDPYDAFLNGQQANLGPKWEVNAATGLFSYPPSNPAWSGSVDRRLQVKISDIDPAQDGGGTYFVEGQYVAPDDAAAGNGHNNCSYRQVGVSGSGSDWTFSLSGMPGTVREQAGIRAWRNTDPSVNEKGVEIPGDGFVIVSSQATDLGSGWWHYEYAVQNVNSDRSIGSFSVPINDALPIQNIDFHDVDYHSGDPNPWSDTDWPGIVSSGQIEWATEDHSVNAAANAIRWGTLYNFRFDMAAPPTTANATLGVFVPGTPTAVSVSAIVPDTVGGPLDCNSNGVDDILDITSGTSRDCDGNLIPDECQTFPECTLSAELLVGGLNQPLGLVHAPGDSTRLFIVEQPGRIRIWDRVGEAMLGPSFLDISSIVSSSGERGLLSMAFDPDYDTNGFFYVNYTNLSGNTVVARYTVSGNPNVANSGSAVIMKTITQDFSNHNGGQLQFGPDDMLYVGMGDGGSGNDPNNRAQNGLSLLGKLLRLDPDNPPTYVAAGNPFIGVGSTLDEIWATGMRNPWRFSFDRDTGDLWIGDVGQNAREEIDFQPASSTGGENYGWRCMEGFACTGLSGCTCNSPSLTLPIEDVSHGDSGTCSITGGYVYRGCEIPWLNGTYFYADYCGDYIRTLRYDAATSTVFDQRDVSAELAPYAGAIVTFGEDTEGELYFVSSTGSIYKIVCEGPPPPAICGNGVVEGDEECDPPDGFNCDCDCKNVVGGGFADCNGNCVDDAIDVLDGTSLDCNANGIPDECEAMGSLIYNITVSPVLSIPDGTGAFVSTSFVVPHTGVIEDLNLDLTINHTWNGDLTVRLTHSGTTVVLIDRPGLPAADPDYGFDNDGYDIILDDEGAGGAIESADSGGGLLSSPPSYVPDNPLSAFDGQDITGLWTLEVSDSAAPDPGNVSHWGLLFTVETGPIEPCDCNGNGVSDATDLALGTSQDCNLNNEPDECEIASGAEIDLDGGPIGVRSGGDSLINTFCFGCHNTDGSGGAGFPGPNIRNTSRVTIWEKLLPPTTHPGGAFPLLTQQDFADLEAFLADGGSRGRPDLVPDSCQTLVDCNTNGVSDGRELEKGSQVDLDYDGIPDDCEPPCPWDFNTTSGDGTPNGNVGLGDLTEMLNHWGACPAQPSPCPWDFNTTSGDGTPNGSVGLGDLTEMLNNWGACP